MPRRATEEDYRTLGLSPGADAREVERAYHRMKALYAEGSLATYSLLEEEERAGKMVAIERAYMRIAQDLREDSPTMPLADDGGEDLVHAHPDRHCSVGMTLRDRREALGLSIRDVSARTRIRSTYLEHIEDGRYDSLPAPVYLRGFVMEYARLLGMPDPEGLAARFLREAAGEEEP